ncbi:MAG: glycosyltransferase [Acidobacteriota bacterium]
MRIAILGTRGVPPAYGGFETFAGEISTRLARRGHDVTVYCRKSLYRGEPSIWHGVRRVELSAVRHKYFETVSHTFLSALHVLRAGTDVALVCNAANAFALPILRVARIPVAINVDGIERTRRKWNAAGRFVYLAGEALSAEFADALIADAAVIGAYYLTNFGRRPVMIPYGSQFSTASDTDILKKLGIEPRRYLLYVSRFEPENNPLEVLRSFLDARLDVPLVMVGDAPYAMDLVRQVHAQSTSNVILPGAIYGPDYETLQRNALLYIQATEVGGTHPAMIEAMASGGAVLANDTPENREVGGDTVQYFDVREAASLKTFLRRSIDAPAMLDVYRSKARNRAHQLYDWERVTDEYERLFRRLAR